MNQQDYSAGYQALAKELKDKLEADEKHFAEREDVLIHAGTQSRFFAGKRAEANALLTWLEERARNLFE